MSSLMPVPFQLAPDVIPESVLGGADCDLVETSDPSDLLKEQNTIGTTIFPMA
jgi:hypothetical protein